MYKKISELGRSMVEMLGTLAIIGVLSIGGIMGYNYGINKYRANETIRDVTLYAMTASQQLLAGQTDFNFGELGNGVSTLGYAIDGEHGIIDADTGEMSEGSEDYFYIYVDGVPPRVCERILDSDWSAPLVMEVNGKAYTNSVNICYEDEADTVDMAFQFVADLNGDTLPYGTCETDTDCIGNCATCSDGLCVSACTDGQICLRDIRGGNMMCCPRENRAGPYCCPSTKNGMCCNESGQCCPWNMPLADKDGNCYACDTTTAKIDITGVESNCDVCPNRETFAKRIGVGRKDTPSFCSPKCAPGQWKGIDGECLSCDSGADFFSVHGKHPDEQSQCVDICDGKRFIEGSYCKPVCAADQVNTVSGCKKCDTSNFLNLENYTTQEEAKAACDKCPDHTYYDSQSCVKDCPAGQFRGSYDGLCYDCDDPVVRGFAGRNAGDSGYCETACPGMRVSIPMYESNQAYAWCCAKLCDAGQYMDYGGNCHDCVTGNDAKATGAECGKCSNRERQGVYCVRKSCGENQFHGADGNCYDCSEPNPIKMGKYTAECDLCPNRVLNGSNGNSYCSLPCPNGEFADNDGECVPCDDEESVYFYGQSYARAECGKCEGRNLYSFSINDAAFACTLKCPDETPIRGADGNCYACDEEKDINLKINESILKGMCSTECSDTRFMEGQYCKLIQ